ncbi:zinc finger protein 888-like [Gigantopelta aegis]|uniref:zinc finger protein 888-like n=1 Tax=Gigantopelta aegis TaxID=1735272 RepID=UPI001B8895F0|nr:zinc finger protein 888-like [Gigantopelta aegis]
MESHQSREVDSVLFYSKELQCYVRVPSDIGNSLPVNIAAGGGQVYTSTSGVSVSNSQEQTHVVTSYPQQQQQQQHQQQQQQPSAHIQQVLCTHISNSDYDRTYPLAVTNIGEQNPGCSMTSLPVSDQVYYQDQVVTGYGRPYPQNSGIKSPQTLQRQYGDVFENYFTGSGANDVGNKTGQTNKGSASDLEDPVKISQMLVEKLLATETNSKKPIKANAVKPAPAKSTKKGKKIVCHVCNVGLTTLNRKILVKMEGTNVSYLTTCETCCKIESDKIKAEQARKLLENQAKSTCSNVPNTSLPFAGSNRCATSHANSQHINSVNTTPSQMQVSQTGVKITNTNTLTHSSVQPVGICSSSSQMPVSSTAGQSQTSAVHLQQNSNVACPVIGQKSVQNINCNSSTLSSKLTGNAPLVANTKPNNLQAKPNVWHQKSKPVTVCGLCSRKGREITCVIAKVKEDNTLEYIDACNICVKKKLEKKKRKKVRHSISELKRIKSKCNRGTQSEDNPLKWKCQKCYKTFQRKNEMLIHKRTHRKPRVIQCVSCEEELKYYSLQKPFKCEHCDRIYDPKSISDMEKIKRSQRGNDVFKCSICDKVLATAKGVKEHEKTHSLEKPFVCYICHKTFKFTTNLRLHMRTHTNERPFKCEMCGRAFKQSSGLIQHIRLHTGEKPWACSICGKRYGQKSNFTRHMFTHNKSKSYACFLCDKFFNTDWKLTRHMKFKHSDSNPYRCDICGKDYEENSSFRRHLEKHGMDNKFRCKVCGKQFSATNPLQQHLKTHLTEQKGLYNCGLCSFQFNDEAQLNGHIRQHFSDNTHGCSQCEAVFPTRGLLEHHLKQKHSAETVFDCSLCGRQFTLKVNYDVHMRKHNGHLPFECHICGKRYQWSNTLESHMTIHANETSVSVVGTAAGACNPAETNYLNMPVQYA